MTEDQIRGVIAEARELSAIFFSLFQKDIENRILSNSTWDQERSFLIEEHKKVSDTLKYFPSFLYHQEEEIVEILAVDLHETPVQYLSTYRPDINPLFKELYAVYDKLIKRDNKFQILITRHRPGYFQEEYDDLKNIYEKVGVDSNISYFYPSTIYTSIFESGFYVIIHIITFSYFYLLKEKLSYYEAIIAEFMALGDGIDCSLNPEDKKKLHKGLVGKFIDNNTKEAHFIAAFTLQQLPYGFQKIKWTVMKNANEPHKTSLREFLTMYCVKVPSQKDINRIFTDINNNEIIIPKPKTGEFSIYYRDLEKLLE